MKIKQTLRRFIFAIVVTLGMPIAIISPAFAASCGGVQTSIISCGQKGVCADGTNAYQGSDPGTNTTKITNYQIKYGHAFAICKDGSAPDNSLTSNGVWGVLLVAINILTAGIGIAAVGGIVYGSILYASSGGEAEGVKKGKTVITNVIIGLIAYALMYSLLNFIIPGGLFN